jgi:LuxR family maltose regulon positive regulatory protein
VWGLLFTNRAAFAAMRGESQQAADLARQARRLTMETDYASLARLGHAEGMASFLLGKVNEAEAAFYQAMLAAQKSRNRNLVLDCISCLALTQIQQGRLNQAVRTCQEALAGDPENQRAPSACTVRFALAQGLYEQNELRAAQTILETDLGVDHRFGRPHIFWQVTLLKAKILLGLGDLPGTAAAIEQAGQSAARFGYAYASRMVSASRARMDMAQGHLEAAARWAEAYQSLKPTDELRDIEELTLAHILLSEGKFSEAICVLDRVLQATKAERRTASEIEASILRAITLDRLGDPERAVEALLSAVCLAEPEGFIRMFLDGGSDVASLLTRVRQMKVPASSLRFIARLLGAFQENGIVLDSDSVDPAALDALIEPLSARELEVLRLIAEGLSNHEIAARLYLSVNTLRAHASNIYQKLDVHNRLQAVTRAKELGLLTG